MLLETSRIYLEVIYLIGHSHCHTPFWPISILSDQATDRSSYRAELRQRFIPPAHFKPEITPNRHQRTSGDEDRHLFWA